MARREILTVIAALPHLLTYLPAEAQGPPVEEQGTAAKAAPSAVTSPIAPKTTHEAVPPVPVDEATTVPALPRGGQEEIIVTGSRIRRKDLTTPAPVTVITREQLQASGQASLGDFLQTLPEQGNAINTAVNNGGDGSTRVSLRGLGSRRTLVLLNGRRFVPGGTGADSSVDLNSIPIGAIDRVEVLKDGGSAIYGSDALAGVVNVITRRRYEGLDVSAYSGTSRHSDGAVYDINVTTGASSDRGSILFSAGYYKQKSIFAGARGWSTSQLFFDATGKATGNATGKPGPYPATDLAIPAGAFAIPQSQVGVADPTATPLYNDLVKAYPNDNTFIYDPTSTLGYRAFTPGDGYNFAPANYLVTPSQRISLYSSGETRLNRSARAFFEASYVNRQSEQQLASEAFEFTGLSLSKSSIYNPFGVDLTDIRRRIVEAGNRRFTQDVDTYRIVVGLDGELPGNLGALKGWYWEIFGNYGHTSGDELLSGSLVAHALAQAMGPSFSDASGAHCGTPDAPIAGCVPIDLLHVNGPISPEMLQGLTFTGVQRGYDQLTTVNVNASGPLFSVLAERPASLALGYEYRNVQGAQVPDPITAAGDTTGNRILATAGGYHSNEGYAELSVPIIDHAPWLHTLETTAAVRVFDYSTFGSDWTYKLGARYAPLRDVTLRGTYSTAYRAPSVSDLFLGQSDSFPPVSDPCAGPGIDPNSTLGRACGSAVNNGDNQQQIRTRVGGNPRLQPETAKIYTLGLVLEPSFARHLTVTADYYNIDIDRPITVFGAANILQTCYPSGGGGAPPFCSDLITRDPASHRITNIVDLNTNAGSEKTAGIDLALQYRLPTVYGQVGLTFDGTWLQKYDRQIGSVVIHGKGNYDLGVLNSGIGGVYPTFKFNTGLTWSFARLAAGVSTRFIGGFTECGDSTGNFAGSGLCYIDSTYQRHVDAYQTWDLFLSYTLSSVAGRTTIAAGVQNAFDRNPPLIYNAFTGTDPTAYDLVGRFFYARLAHHL